MFVCGYIYVLYINILEFLKLKVYVSRVFLKRIIFNNIKE